MYVAADSVTDMPSPASDAAAGVAKFGARDGNGVCGTGSDTVLPIGLTGSLTASCQGPTGTTPTCPCSSNVNAGECLWSITAPAASCSAPPPPR